MWILHMDQTDGCTIIHARNGREFRLPELLRYSVNGYCAETRTVYECLGCFWHGCKCQPMRDRKTLDEDTLAERYEKTMARIEQIAAAGYTIRVMWECKFDEEKIVERKPELLTNPIVRHSPYTLETPCTEVGPKPCVYIIRSRRKKKKSSNAT